MSKVPAPSARAQFLAGARDELPILAGTIPFGLIYGVAALGAGVPRGLAQAMSVIIFAGSAQFVVAQFIGASVPAVVIVVTGFVINLRHALYSASIAPYTERLASGWKWLLAYLLTDEAYAVAITHYRREGDAIPKRWYFLGAGLALWVCWQISTAVGVFLGAQVPASWSLDFALPLTFIALVVPAIKDRTTGMTALVAGVAAVVFMALPFKSGLLLAIAFGIAAGVSLDHWRRGGLPAGESQGMPDEAGEAGKAGEATP